VAVVNGVDLPHNSFASGLMTSPSPSDLCWVIGFTPNGRWIIPVMRTAVGLELERAREIARTRLGDERLASEIMELAIQQTAESLADMSPIGIEETQAILARLYQNEVRRRLRTASRLSYRGSSAQLEYMKPSDETTFSAVEAELDLEKILRETQTDTRIAMLLRYGARSRWKEVAQELAKSTEATRKACEREMERIRKALGL